MTVSATNDQKITFYDVSNSADDDCGICRGTEQGTKKAHDAPGYSANTKIRHIFHESCLQNTIKTSINSTGDISCPICRKEIDITSVFSKEEVSSLLDRTRETKLVNSHLLKNAFVIFFASTIIQLFQANQFFPKDPALYSLTLSVGLIDAYRRDRIIERGAGISAPVCILSACSHLVAIPIISTIISYIIPNTTLYNVSLPVSSIITAIALGIGAAKGLTRARVYRPLNNHSN